MSNWDPSKHPRHPAGSPQGGEFAPAVGEAVSVSPPGNSNFQFAGQAKVLSFLGDQAKVAYQTSSIHPQISTVPRSWLKPQAKGFQFNAPLISTLRQQGAARLVNESSTPTGDQKAAYNNLKAALSKGRKK